MRALLSLLLAASSGVLLLVAPAVPVRAGGGFSYEVLLTGLGVPISVGLLPDGRLLILDRLGGLTIADPDTLPVPTASYMTLTNINFAGEKGLFDVTLDPGFATNGYFYLYYTAASPARARVSRFTHQENAGGLTSTGNAASELVIWQDTDSYVSTIHYGGGLDFGPDGNLYLTTGDKSNPGFSQDLTRSSGKVIRIRPDGTIPPDNPFVDGPGGLDDGIYAFGLRNPYRARWDFPSGRLFIGEVGGNNNLLSWEDVHVLAAGDAGRNFGWPYCEGACDNPDFAATCNCNLHDDPIFAYPHAGAGAAVVGGVVYRGSQFPADPFYGAYLYGDYVRGWVRYLTFDPSGTTVTGDFPLDLGAGPVLFIGESLDGSVYLTDWFGRLRRIRYDAGNQAPSVVSTSATPSEGTAPLVVTLRATVSDPEGDALTYAWDFGDGGTDSGTVAAGVVPDVVHSYTANGVYGARLFVSDATHTAVSPPRTVRVGTPPLVTLLSPGEGALFQAGQVISFNASASDPDGTLGPGAVRWTILFRHNEHFHPALEGYVGTSGTFPIPLSGHDFSGDTGYLFVVEATDADGLTAADTASIVPDKANLTFDTAPSGLTVFVDDVPRNTPYVLDTVKGFQHLVSAPLTACSAGEGQNFLSWSNGQPATHTYTVPPADDFLLATYAGGGDCVQPPAQGLVLRLRADDRVTVSGSRVIFWRDGTPYRNDLAIVTGIPTLVPGAINGHNAIRFDTVDDALGRAGMNGLPLGDADRSVFLVTRHGPDGSGVFLYGKDACNRTFGLAVRENDGRLVVEGRCPPNDFIANALGIGGAWMTHSAILENDILVHYKNGKVVRTTNHVFDTADDVILLYPPGDDESTLDMEVAEILVYDRALSEAERREVEDYFRIRYLGEMTPAVAVTAPAEGDTVFGETVTAIWESSGDLSDADQVRVTLDGGPPQATPALTGALPFPGVLPGAHTVLVELLTPSLQILAADTVSFHTRPAPVGCSLVTDGLVLHLESDHGVQADGPDVTGWLDQSGLANHFLATGGPRLEPAGGPNGQPYISFDGLDDRMQRSPPFAGFPLGVADRTAFFVVRYHEGAYGGFGYGAPVNNQAFFLATNGVNLTVYGYGPAYDFATFQPGVGAGWLTQSVYTQGGDFQHFANGELLDFNYNEFNTVLQAAFLAETVDEDDRVRMDAAAVLLYDRTLSDPERTQVGDYLQQKYFGAPCAPADLPPVAVADSAALLPADSVLVDVLANDYDTDGTLDSSSTLVLSPPSLGTATPGAQGAIHYVSDGTPGVDHFTYLVRDAAGNWSNEATVTVLAGAVVSAEAPPVRLALYQNRPNPLSRSAVIGFDLPRAQPVSLAVYDVQGRRVRQAFSRTEWPAGRHVWTWDGRDDGGAAVGSGIYFYSLVTPDGTLSRKAVVAR